MKFKGFVLIFIFFVFISGILGAQTNSTVASRTEGADVYYYSTLHEAFDAAQGSIIVPDEISLLADITANEMLVIEDGKHIVLVPGGGDRTIRRGSTLIENPIFWVSGDSASLSLGKPEMEHELVIDGGYMKDLESLSPPHSFYRSTGTACSC